MLNTLVKHTLNKNGYKVCSISSLLLQGSAKCILLMLRNMQCFVEKVQVGKDQEKAQSEKDSHSKNRGGKKPN